MRSPLASIALFHLGPIPITEGVVATWAIMAVLVIALLLGGLGFAVHALWIVAGVVFVAWLLGFGLARGEGAGGRSRWYRW